MTELNQVYKCEICGNIVEIIHAGMGQLVCCGQPMRLLKEETKEQLKEKHLPVIKFNEKGIEIEIGKVLHPMEENHFIEWIEISTEKGTSKKFLNPGEKPRAQFFVKSNKIKARAYCNVHGLWAKK